MLKRKRARSAILTGISALLPVLGRPTVEVRYFDHFKMASKSPTVSTNSRIKTPSATVSRPGSSTPIVITSFAMKDCERQNEFNSIQMCTPMDLDSIMDKLKECDAIKYAAYRTATKLDILRSALRLDQVKLGAVTSAFHQHGVKSALSDAKFSPSKAADVIADIFFSAGKVSLFSKNFLKTLRDSLYFTDSALFLSYY